MPPKRQSLSYTFPHRMVFVISFVLCLCACASIVNAVLAWNNVLWGFYFGTGFWCGGVILFAGMFGIVASFVRNMCSVKTFMIISIFGCMTSLGMIALAAGGLDSDSGFYDGNNRGVLMTHVVHAVYLGLGLLQLTLCVLSDGICIYYLFIEKNAEIYRVKNFNNSKKPASNIVRESKNRSSTGSEVPLVGRNSSKRKQQNDSDNNSSANKSGSNNNVGNELEEDEPIRFNTTKSLNREALRCQENPTSPIRNPYIRSASFSTFGRGGGHERVSLIVHPTDDNASVADSSASQIADDRFGENAYAQIPLFGPPLPIEDDDELPPYEAVDKKFLKRGRKRGLKRPKSEEIQFRNHPARRAYTTPTAGKRKLEKRMRNSYNRSQIPPGRIDNSCERDATKHQRLSNMDDKSVGRHSVKGLSRSADLLSMEGDATYKYFADENYNDHTQGVAHRDFAHSSDMILAMDEQVPLRHRRSNQTQSLRGNRDKRIDRKRKALSAELGLNKDQFLVHDRLINDESDFQFDGSNPSLYAGNRIVPTKFSLRRPMRRVGMPHISAPVPVKPIVTVPSVHGHPPPKPPRTHSVTPDDLRNDEKEINYEVEVEHLFAGINELNDVDDVFSNEPFKVSTRVEPTIETTSLPMNKTDARRIPHNTASIPSNADKVYKEESPKTIESKPIAYVSSTKSVPLSPDVKLDSGPMVKFQPQSPEVKLDSGPVLKFVPPKQLPNPIKTMNENEENKHMDSMTLPTSPVLSQPTSDKIPVSYKNDGSVQANRTWKKSDQTNKIKLPETAKTLHYSSPNTGGTNVINAQVTKDSPVSPVYSESSLSPTSPTSPTSRMLKARRLLYSFTDKDVNVFDPVSTGRETEEVAEVVDTQSVKYPVKGPGDVAKKPNVYNGTVGISNNGAISNITVRSAPLSLLGIIQGDIKRETTSNSATSAKDIEKKPNIPRIPERLGSGSAVSSITVRSPPLSASERILQRKTVTADTQNDFSASKDRPVILQPVMNSPSRNSYGARPKTNYQGLFAPLPAPKPTEKPVAIQSFDKNKDNKLFFNFDKSPSVATSTISNPTPVQPSSPISNSVQSEPSPRFSRQQVSLPSPLSLTSTAPTSASITRSSPSMSVPSPTTSSRNVTTDPVMINNVLLPTPPATVSASREVPVNRVQATPARSSNSQGVQHLPQSQYSRQVSDNSPRPVLARDYPQAAALPPNANIAQQNNDDSTNKPLFSVVL